MKSRRYRLKEFAYICLQNHYNRFWNKVKIINFAEGYATNRMNKEDKHLGRLSKELLTTN